MKTPTTFRELMESRAEHELRLRAALLGWDPPFATVPTPLTETRPEPPKPATARQVSILLEAFGVREVEPTVADRLARALGGR